MMVGDCGKLTMSGNLCNGSMLLVRQIDKHISVDVIITEYHYKCARCGRMEPIEKD